MQLLGRPELNRDNCESLLLGVPILAQQEARRGLKSQHRTLVGRNQTGAVNNKIVYKHLNGEVLSIKVLNMHTVVILQ